jgi:hypothetical protein
MHDYALVFHTSRDPLAPDALARRNAAARDWAIALGATLRHAAPFDDGGVVVTAAGTTAVPADAIASILVIEAESLDAAVARVKQHPGLAFGTAIEVRPVKALAQGK